MADRISTEAEHFALGAPPPVRALAIAAGAALGAIVLLGIALAGRATTVLTVAAAVLLVLGLALGLGAVVLARRLRTSVRVDDRAITVWRGGVRRGRRTESVAWSDIDEVVLEGARLNLVPKTGEGLVLANPRAPTDPTFVALLRAIRQRLDKSRGYGGRPFGGGPAR